MSFLNIPLLIESTDALGIHLDNTAIERFSCYADMLCEWNQKMNLTAVDDPDGIAVTHFADSLTLLSSCEIKKGVAVLDVGSGAGFPSIPMLIVRPDLQLTLLDSLNKRLVFLDALLEKLGLVASTIHSRAEDGARDNQMRECFELVTARAVASLPALCEYCLPFVKVSGTFAAMKGPSARDELKSSENAIKLLGGSLEDVKDFTLKDGSSRSIILIKKIKSTPSIYPRTGTKITKNPL